MQLEERFLFCQFRGNRILIQEKQSEAVLSFFPRGGSLRSGQLFEGGEQVSVAELLLEFPPE
jgi:hypothetical protein